MENKIKEEIKREIIKEYADEKISKECIEVLENVWSIINTGQIDYTKCRYCSELIEKWTQARRLIKDEISKLENDRKKDVTI